MASEAHRPVVDHHVHLFSPATRDRLAGISGRALPPFTAAELIPVLDEDGIEVAVVLSTAYFYTGSMFGEADARLMTAENDWVADETERSGVRLVPFFSVNPIHPSAAAEIERCAASGRFAGLKVHLANSAVDLMDSAHVERLAEVFALVNAHRLPVVVHARPRGEGYGTRDAEVFIDHVLRAATDIDVQIAHVGGWGGYDEPTDRALEAYCVYIASTPDAHLLFDLSAVVRPVRPDEATPTWDPADRYQKLSERLRTLGRGRLLFGTDWPEWTPSSYWHDIVTSVSLGADSREQIRSNRARWARPT